MNNGMDDPEGDEDDDCPDVPDTEPFTLDGRARDVCAPRSSLGP